MTTETETRTGIYEAMFLASQSAAADFNGLIEHINHLFERCHGTVVAMKKWDERRLAYEIDKQKRGVYILAYFTCSTDQIAQLERDAQISDQIMRLLVTTADHLTDEEIAACDDRQGLNDEAKLKAEQGAREEEILDPDVRIEANLVEIAIGGEEQQIAMARVAGDGEEFVGEERGGEAGTVGGEPRRFRHDRFDQARDLRRDRRRLDPNH